MTDLSNLSPAVREDLMALYSVIPWSAKPALDAIRAELLRLSAENAAGKEGALRAKAALGYALTEQEQMQVILSEQRQRKP